MIEDDEKWLSEIAPDLDDNIQRIFLDLLDPRRNRIHWTDGDNAAFFYDVLDQCRDMGVLNVTLSGGEPLLHKNFLDFLRKAKEYDFAINILSNLTLLNDEIIAEMKANRLSSVQVSLYSMKPENHDSITCLPGSFQKTHNAILKLIENDIPLQISCPTMKQNKSDYVDVLNWAQKHKVRAATDYIMMARYDHTTGDPLKMNEHFCKVAALNRKIALDWKGRLQEQRKNDIVQEGEKHG